MYAQMAVIVSTACSSIGPISFAAPSPAAATTSSFRLGVDYALPTDSHATSCDAVIQWTLIPIHTSGATGLAVNTSHSEPYIHVLARLNQADHLRHCLFYYVMGHLRSGSWQITASAADWSARCTQNATPEGTAVLFRVGHDGCSSV
jgi:hypothetical protein